MNIEKEDMKRGQKGMTIIEITLVMTLLIGLAGLSLLATGGMSKWKKGKAASENLRVVYLAQKTFMADHPTTSVSALTPADLVPYLATGATAVPQIEDLTGGMLDIVVTVMPPVITGNYDPSGSTDDGVWDVGNP